jgi:predicted Zn-dependent protease
MQLAPRDIRRVIDLAALFAKQGHYQESENLFDLAREIAPDSPKLFVARAASYIQTGRNLVEASALLQRYSGSPHTHDAPPSSEVERLLKASGKRDVSASGASSRGTSS